ncbi:MAG TPA: MOSC N-terminal beta barrel domain-containing protein [Candidatus Tectomicrobia bacterium]|nr:MOSC N-terminal beta barrel domain-containing protein [Candidatus Tectomicrobia bacterium]
MERRQIGLVRDLFRYPVKSLQGERLSVVEIGAHGVIGDRAYALQVMNGRVMTAKKWPDLLDFCAYYETPPRPGDLAPLRITLPDGRTLYAQDPDASSALSAMLGRTVMLQRAQGDQHSRAEIDPATVFGDVPVETVKPGFTAATLPDSFALPPGTFFDSASIHVLASGTLSHLHTLTGEDAQLDPRRFRPNIVVETAPGLEGFLEDDWLGGTLEVGTSVRIVQMRGTLRCVMTTHQQFGLGRDLRILRTAAQHHGNQVGVWAAVGAPGTVRVDDPVMLVK